ncbi:MAG: porin [Chitinophagaceae bacterium]
MYNTSTKLQGLFVRKAIVLAGLMALIFSCITGTVYGQDYSTTAPAAPDTAAKKNAVKEVLKKLNLSGTIRMRYTASFTKRVDVTGMQHSSDDPSFTENDFNIPQARLVAQRNITDKLSIYLRANFGDFAFLPQGRVLEYAYTNFAFNDYLNVRAGLSKPFFGREDDISQDFLKSFDYSNQYNLFSLNGWTSYQLGVTVFGEVKLSEIPVRYYLGVFNGNGRIDFGDNENGKVFPARIEVDLDENFLIGLNGGWGREFDKTVKVWGADVNFQRNLTPRFQYEIEAEYKQGNNQNMFLSQIVPIRPWDNFKARGFYILPSVEYKLHGRPGMGLEASFKYEYLDPDFKVDGNVWQEFVPLIGMDFAPDFDIRLQVGAVFDRFKRSIENSVTFNCDRFITQLQLRF